jgi:hypothetical protein
MPAIDAPKRNLDGDASHMPIGQLNDWCTNGAAGANEAPAASRDADHRGVRHASPRS